MEGANRTVLDEKQDGTAACTLHKPLYVCRFNAYAVFHVTPITRAFRNVHYFLALSRKTVGCELYVTTQPTRLCYIFIVTFYS